MDDRRLGMAVRARRHLRGWRLVDLAAVAAVGATSCSMLERGRADGLTVRTARAIAGAVDLPLGWDIGWQRQEIDRLLDADHAALGSHVVRRLEAWGWTVRAEVSFNEYGDRGRIDILATHAASRALLVVELIDAHRRWPGNARHAGCQVSRCPGDRPADRMAAWPRGAGPHRERYHDESSSRR